MEAPTIIPVAQSKIVVGARVSFVHHAFAGGFKIGATSRVQNCPVIASPTLLLSRRITGTIEALSCRWLYRRTARGAVAMSSIVPAIANPTPVTSSAFGIVGVHSSSQIAMKLRSARVAKPAPTSRRPSPRVANLPAYQCPKLGVNIALSAPVHATVAIALLSGRSTAMATPIIAHDAAVPPIERPSATSSLR
ncbi:MAG TPA: hypothetical protein VGD80_22565 [Kofleriaceae bacterium]